MDNFLPIYLPDGGTSDLWGVAVTACGVTRVSPGVPYPPEPSRHPGDHLFALPKGGRILDCYQLVFITSGIGSFESTATGILKLEAGSAVLLFPSVWHRYAPSIETGWTEFFLELKGPVLDRLRQHGVIRPQNPVFDLGGNPGIIDGFRAIQGFASAGGVGSREQMATMGIHLLAQTIHSRRTPAPSREDRAVLQAELRMREDLGLCPDMAALAGEFGIGYDRFRRRFKSMTGLAPKQYHRQLQMRRAEELFLSTDRTLADIADELGFHSAFHLSAAFKAHCGQAPSHWKKSRTGQG